MSGRIAHDTVEMVTIKSEHERALIFRSSINVFIVIWPIYMNLEARHHPKATLADT